MGHLGVIKIYLAPKLDEAEVLVGRLLAKHFVCFWYCHP